MKRPGLPLLLRLLPLISFSALVLLFAHLWLDESDSVDAPALETASDPCSFHCVCTGALTSYRPCLYRIPCVPDLNDDPVRVAEQAPTICEACPGATHRTRERGFRQLPVKLLASLLSPLLTSVSGDDRPTTAETAQESRRVYRVGVFNPSDDVAFYRNEAVLYCSGSCHFEQVGPRRDWKQYDVLIFSLIYISAQRIERMAREKPAHQQWIAHCGESPHTYYGRHLRDHALLNRHFDLRSFAADPGDGERGLAWNYLQMDLFGERSLQILQRSVLAEPAVMGDRRSVAWIATNCAAPNGRTDYVRELQQYVEVDCLGACLNNKPFPLSDTRTAHGWEQRSVWAMSRYRFVLAFENSDAPHYVTEKLFHAFYAGAVPVYMGTSTVDLYLPGDHSVVRTADFSSPAELAAYLNRLTQNQTEYAAYHQWRHKPTLRASFLQLLHRSLNTLPCRVCEWIAAADLNYSSSSSSSSSSSTLSSSSSSAASSSASTSSSAVSYSSSSASSADQTSASAPSASPVVPIPPRIVDLSKLFFGGPPSRGLLLQLRPVVTRLTTLLRGQ